MFVPDWDSTGPDRGRGDLLASLAYVRARAGDDVALAGWSLGAAVAAGVVLVPEVVLARYDPAAARCRADPALERIAGASVDALVAAARRSA